MHDISVISTFGLDVSFKTEIYCELYVDMIPNTPKNSTRILWVLEPNEISGFKNIAINNYDNFDLILTWDTDILKSCPNSKLFPYGTTWIKDFDLSQKKEYCITTLIGGKNKTFGHLLRHSLVEKHELIKSIPVHFFNSLNIPFTRDRKFKNMESKLWKNELFYSQFHIAIENNSSKNYFTEKIIDCFQTKTIPIYFGCSNIEEYFDLRGIFYVSSVDEIIDVCNNIDKNTYENMIDYVNINYKNSIKYADFRKRIENEITSFIENYIA